MLITLNEIRQGPTGDPNDPVVDEKYIYVH